MLSAIFARIPKNDGNIGQYLDELSCIHDDANSLISKPAPLDEFVQFLRQVYNTLILGDAAVRVVLLRVIRLALHDASHCNALIKEEIHWIIISSLERDHDYVQERMQALKVMKKFISISPGEFPQSFMRSLVAVANHKDDNIRRVCLETLRQLTVINPAIVLQASGLSCLLDAVIEPSTHDMAESILMSVLYLLNDSSSRWLCFIERERLIISTK